MSLIKAKIAETMLPLFMGKGGGHAAGDFDDDVERPLSISQPESFRHGIHVSFREGQMMGIPRVWKEELHNEWGAQSAAVAASKTTQEQRRQHEGTDELAALPTVIRPTVDDLRYVKKRHERSRRPTLISSMRGTIKFRRPALPAQIEPAVRESSGPEPRRTLLKPKRSNAHSQGPSRHDALKAMAAETRVIRAINEATDTLTLNLSSCGIEELREEWFTVARADIDRTLKSVDLGFNRFKWFPLQLLWFSQCLSTLRLDGNELSELPPHIGLLKQLIELSVNGNLLTELPPAIGHCSSLEILEIKNNQIKKLPRELGRLSRLGELHLSGNAISRFPTSIGGCTRLQVLDASWCKLERLPEEILHITSLIELNLAHNNITVLPPSIGLLTRLADLDLSNNCLVELPLSMGLLSCKHFGCDGNPLRDLELIEQLDMGVGHAFRYLEKRMDACIPINDHEEYQALLREKRPPLSPICYPPLPPTPFKFTASGNLRLAIPRSIPVNVDSDLLSALADKTQDDKSPKQKQTPLAKNEAMMQRSASALYPKGSDSDSHSSSPSSSPGLERGDTVAEQPTAGLSMTKGATEESEEVIHGKLNELKALSENLVIVILEIVEDFHFDVNELATLPEAVVLAKQIRSLKEEMVLIRSHEEVCALSESLKASPPCLVDDKLLLLKSTITTALYNTSITIRALNKAIGLATDFETLFPFTRHLKSLYLLLRRDVGDHEGASSHHRLTPDVASTGLSA